MWTEADDMRSGWVQKAVPTLLANDYEQPGLPLLFLFILDEHNETFHIPERAKMSLP